MKGTRIGSYLIEDKIGEGGMGVVYRARHERMNRPAVVKMLRKQLVSNPQIARRFENEATAAASIGHPGIVQVFDVGQHSDGSLYIVMELLQGEELQKRLSRVGRLPIPEALTIIKQAAGALSAAHKAGIVHRDLKPDNMFIVPDPEVPGGERVKLLDFGIAKLSDDGGGAMKTKTGVMMGTPHYMSPEQCQGASTVDPRSDLYSLGCILFQLITGRTPFVGEGVGDFIVSHMTQAPPLLRSLAPEAPQALEDVVSTLLAKDPNQRFGSADALLNALNHVPETVGAGTNSIPLTEIAPPLASSFANAGSTAGPPPTTMGLSAGETANAHSMDAGPRASPSEERGRGGAGRLWAVIGVLAILTISGLSYALFTRKPPPKPEVAAASGESTGTVEATTPSELAILASDAALPASGAATASTETLPNGKPALAEPIPSPEVRTAGGPGRAAVLKAKREAAKKAERKAAAEAAAQAAAERLAAKQRYSEPSKWRESATAKQRESEAAKRRESEAAKRRESEAAKRRESEAAKQRESEAAQAKQDAKYSAAQPKAVNTADFNIAASVRQSLKDQLPAAKSKIAICAQTHHIKGKKLKVRIGIGASGAVQKAKLWPPGLGQLAKCIEDVAKQLRFDSRVGTQNITIPIDI